MKPKGIKLKSDSRLETKIFFSDYKIRERYATCTGILEQVKDVSSINIINGLTSRQVSEFFETKIDTIYNVFHAHEEELLKDGVRMEKINTGTEARVFPYRAVLKIGMLLSRSNVAAKVRELLIDQYGRPKQESVVQQENPNNPNKSSKAERPCKTCACKMQPMQSQVLVQQPEPMPVQNVQNSEKNTQMQLEMQLENPQMQPQISQTQQMQPVVDQNMEKILRTVRINTILSASWATIATIALIISIFV